MERARPYFAVFGAIAGGAVAFYLVGPLASLLKTDIGFYESAGFMLFVAAIFAVICFFVGPVIARLVVRGVELIEGRVLRLSLQDIVLSAGGLIVGLIIANLLTPSLARIPLVGSFLPSITMVIMGYIGVAVARSKREDLVAIGPSRWRQPARNARSLRDEQKSELPVVQAVPKILDTSTIIDGRIVDICRSGFIEGPFVIPNFILDELRRIADSSEQLRRTKGRRGLDILNDLQKDVPAEVITLDWPRDGELDVDALLLKMAKETNSAIITTDFNLAKIAELQQVGVLNINELANAMKLMVAPGEELLVEVHREGKQPGQGVGYLDDGTMVVIEHAKKYVGEVISVIVTNVHSSVQGRMIFAKPKQLDKVAQAFE